MSTFTSRLSPGEAFHDGMIKTVKCPSGSDGVTAILLQNAEGESIGEFVLRDANGDLVAGVGSVWAAGRHIRVLFDAASNTAQVLNSANTKATQNRLKTAIITLTAKGWNENTQTVAAPGVPADSEDNAVFPAPAPDHQTAYVDAGIRCTVQADSTLTFVCDVVPTTDITVNVVIFDNGKAVSV